MNEEPFTGFEVIHPPAGSKDFVSAALKAGRTPTEIASLFGTASDEVAAILNISSSSSTNVEKTKDRRTKRYSPPMSPISSLECKRYVDAEDYYDDELSIVSSVTHCIRPISSVYSTECSVFTEYHTINSNALQNGPSDEHPKVSIQYSDGHPNSMNSTFLQRKRNRFTRKIFKKFSVLPLVTEVDSSVDSFELSPSSAAEPKKKRFATQALKKLSMLRKNSATSERKVPSDSSTAASTQASEEISEETSSQSSMNSSITVSTDDFDENTSDDLDNLAFESYLYTSPWDAAKHGDYATLKYIANNEDESNDVWTKQDVSGNVPLYYACVYGGNYGKYGLESVKLMFNVWPGGEVPSDLLKRCLKEAENKCVRKILKEKMGGGSEKTLRRRSSTLLEGTEHVTPQSFLDDLGDDGYVEDY